MNIKCRFFPSRPLYMLFVLNVLQLNVTSSLNSEESLSTEESKQFVSSEDGIEYQMKITYVNLENVYSINDEYMFFIPEVTTECECACTTRDEIYCSDKTHDYNSECAHLMNSTTTCTMYNSIGRDTSVCPNYYRMCCRIFFSKYIGINSYRALHLKFQKSIVKIQVNLKSTPVEENVNVFIPPDVKYFQFISENLLHTGTFIFRLPDRLPDGWYFTQDYSNEVLFTEKINEVDGYNLDKIGWFQFRQRQNELLRVRLMDLMQRLDVKPLNCHSIPPKYEWKLNAEGFYKEGLLKFPKDIRKVSEIYQNSIKNIYLNIKEKITNTEVAIKQLPFSNVSVVSIESLSLFFISNISVFPDKNPFLNIKFNKGIGSMFIEIANPSWKNPLTFSKFIRNASNDSPVTFSYGLPFTNIELFVVCVSQGESQLCRSPTIIRERKTTFQEPTESATQTLHFTSDIGKENATNDYHEKLQQEQTPLSFLNNITEIIILFSILLTLTIVATHFVKWMNRKQLQKKRSTDCERTTLESLIEKKENLERKEKDGFEETFI